MDCRAERSYELRVDGEMSVPGDGSNGNEGGGTVNGGGACGGGVYPRGDSVRGYDGNTFPSSRFMGGIGLRDSNPDPRPERPPEELLPVPVPAE